MFSEICQDPVELRAKKLQTVWNRTYNEAAEFLRQNPEYSVYHFPSGIKGDYVKDIAKWLDTQRRAYHSADSSLNDEQRKKLEALGCEESGYHKLAERNAIWQENCLKLKAFYEKYGHTELPQTEEYSELKKWYIKQRCIIRRGKCSNFRVKFLKENGITELFSQPIRNSLTRINLVFEQSEYDKIMQMVRADGCQSIEDYLLKTANNQRTEL